MKNTLKNLELAILLAIAPLTSNLIAVDVNKLEISNKPSPNFSIGRKSSIEGVVIHSTESSGESALKWLTSPVSKVSSHYLVMENGSIYQLVNDTNTAWHAGKKANSGYIGVEFAGYANKPGFNFTKAQYNSGATLAANLMSKYKIPKEKIVSHDWVTKNLGGTTHSDPGKNFDWKKFNSLIHNYKNSQINMNVK